MLSLRDEVSIANSRIRSPSSATWLYLGAEFLVGAAISGLLALLAVVKCLLPKPPRDLTGDVVLVTGVTSALGTSLAEEFTKAGCSVICVDEDLKSVKETASRLASRYPRVERIGPEHRKQGSPSRKQTTYAYECDLTDRGDILAIAKKVRDDVGQVDVLVTCVGYPNQDILDTVSTTLMSHYWTVLAFLPSMLKRERAHVVGISPTMSTEDAYMGSRAAVAGLMDSLGQEFGSGSSRIAFITVAPKAEPRLLKQTERQIAKNVVQAVRRNQSSLDVNWCSKLLYRISCTIYAGITAITQWLCTQGCEYPL